MTLRRLAVVAAALAVGGGLAAAGDDHCGDRDDALVAAAAASGTCSSSTSRTRATPTRSVRARRRHTSSGRLLPKGQLLDNYYGIAHNSLPNYLAQISGQGPNLQTQADCPVFTDFRRVTTTAGGQAVGTGCVFPADVPTVAEPAHRAPLHVEGLHGGHRQLADGSEDLPPSGDRRGRRHPTARADDQYAARHNPFVYFHSIIDSPVCARNGSWRLDQLAGISAARARRRTWRTSRRTCATTATTSRASTAGRAGSRAPTRGCRCGSPRSSRRRRFAATGCSSSRSMRPSSRVRAPTRRRVVARVPARTRRFPESPASVAGASARWSSPVGPRPGLVNATAYNHYGLLRSIEDLFALDHLGYAGSPSVAGFGSDVFDADLNLPGGVAKPHNPDTVSRLETAARARAEGLGGRGVVAASNRTSLRSLATAALELAALSGAAIAQPLLDEFGRAPDVFIRAGVSRWDIVLFAFVIAVVPVAILLGVEVIVAAFAGERVRHFVHLALVAALGLLLALRALRSVFGWQGALLLVVALAVAAGVAFAHSRWPVMREWLRWAAPLPVIAIVLFLVFSPVADLVRGATAQASASVTVKSERSVVVLLLDEFPALSLLDANGRIDGRRLPNFARLAANPRGSGTRRASARTRSSPCRR